MVMSDERITINGRDYRSGQPVEVIVENSLIYSVSPWITEQSVEFMPWVGPALVDLQLNGYMGMDFNSVPAEKGITHQVSRALLKEGVASYFPTVITNSTEQIEEAVRVIAADCEEDSLTRSCVAGIHLEGPFISLEDGARGAHNKEYVQAPDWKLLQRWQDAAGGRIRILTLSPEWPESPAFIQRCVAAGITVSIGHTASSSEQIRVAVEAGASMSTHFGNGAHPVLPRHPNYLWEQLASEELWACVIADGFHLPESVLKVVHKVKKERMIVVSDAVQLSGMKPGKYQMPVGGEVVLTEEGRLHLAHDPRLLAGSAQLLIWGISSLLHRNICGLKDAWEMASIRPAQKLGLPSAAGLSEGAPADILLLQQEEGRLFPAAMYKSGKQVTI